MREAFVSHATSFTPSREAVLRIANIQASDLLALYLVGSRARGTAHAQSDWDLIAVVRPGPRAWMPLTGLCADGIVPTGVLQEPNARCEIIRAHPVQVFVFDHATFCALLHWQCLFAVQCLFVPERCRFAHDTSFLFTLHRDRLRASIEHSAAVHFSRALQLHAPATPHDVPEASVAKLLAHARDALVMGAQLARTGRLTQASARSRTTHTSLRVRCAQFKRAWQKLTTSLADCQ